MGKKYFGKFPVVSYNGYNVRDITLSAKLMNRYATAPYVYSTVVMDHAQRPDAMAERFYSDPYMSWMIYYANRVIDPYYDWYLDDHDFNLYIVDKYGSIATARKTIVKFRSNWYSDARELTPGQYTARYGEYDAPHNAYWTAVFDEKSGRTISYVRKDDETVVNTNKVAKIQVSNNSTNSASKVATGDLLDFKTGGSVVGTGEAVYCNTTVLYVKNVIGALANGYTVHLDSDGSVYCNVSLHLSSFDAAEAAWTKTNISEEEYVYWEPAAAYDVEAELDAARRTVKMVDPLIAGKVADRLEDELSSK